MTLPDDQVHAWTASLVDRIGNQLRAELAGLVRQVAEALSAREGKPPAEAEVVPGVDPAALVAAAAAARLEGREAGSVLVSAVLGAITALDAARSLSDVLNVLADRAAVHARRVLLVVERGDAMAGWRRHGYADDAGDDRRFDDHGLVARAARTGVTETAHGPAEREPGEAGSGHTRTAVAIPLRVDGRVVAVLYADDDAGDDAAGSPWPEVVGVLARHAARCLESMTARRLTDLVRAAVAASTRPLADAT